VEKEIKALRVEELEERMNEELDRKVENVWASWIKRVRNLQ
jgi:tetrahydromethanopterin S-methyltransferase subunit G